jgi:hypothetical protein
MNTIPVDKEERNGVYHLRWWENGKRKSKSTYTSSKHDAEILRKKKWQELNLEEKREPEPEPIKKTWDECRAALERAMKAANRASGTIENYLDCFDNLRATLPKVKYPADLTHNHGNEYKKLRAEQEIEPPTIAGNLASLRSIFGKWLIDDCGLLADNPFAKVKKPTWKDQPIRVITPTEQAALIDWFKQKWNNWKLPLAFIEVLSLVGWRISALASVKDEQLADDGTITVLPENNKTTYLFAKLSPDLLARVRACSANGFIWGKFSDDLRRHYMLARKRSDHANRVKNFEPRRLVEWFQKQVILAQPGKTSKERFSMHDYKKTAITGMHDLGIPMEGTSALTGTSEKTIRKFYLASDKKNAASKAAENYALATQAQKTGENDASKKSQSEVG